MNRIKVIGIGSPFGDDQLGWQVIEEMQQDTVSQSKRDNQSKIKLSFIQTDRPGTHLLELIKNTDIAIIVDAIDQKDCAGQIQEFDRAQLINVDQPISSHAIGVSEALSLGQAIGGLPEEIILFGICIDTGEIHAIGQEQIERLCKKINDYINKALTTH
jgi:hydrogenase maturation protease